MPPVVVAAFDFDGTLTQRDTLFGFLRRAAGTPALLTTAARLGPRLVAARRDDARRDEAKEAVLRRLLAGRDATRLDELGRSYAQLLVERRLRADVLARLTEHRGRGDRVVIVSASLRTYLDAVGEHLGVDAVLATELEVGPDGRLTGELVGRNCRRAEKVRRLDAWLDSQPHGRDVEVHVYGDSRGDEELLARADHPVRV